jgi:hypothetical protein
VGPLPPIGWTEAGRLVPTDLADAPLDDADRNKLATWTNLYEGLASSRTANKLSDLEPYQRWGRIVARLSFTL